MLLIHTGVRPQETSVTARTGLGMEGGVGHVSQDAIQFMLKVQSL